MFPRHLLSFQLFVLWIYLFLIPDLRKEARDTWKDNQPHVLKLPDRGWDTKEIQAALESTVTKGYLKINRYSTDSIHDFLSLSANALFWKA